VSGRDGAKLQAVADRHRGLEVRVAGIESAADLDRALRGSAAVVNCAGPFAWTSGPVVAAALRAGIAYVDIAAEVEAVADTFAHHDQAARSAGVPVVPAMAFYGGLGDLLAAAAVPPDWSRVETIEIAYWLDSWAPTAGTRASGVVSARRRDGRRVVYRDGALTYRDDAAPGPVVHAFPPPVGKQEVLPEFTMADCVTIGRRLGVPRIESRMSLDAVADLVDTTTPPPVAVDDAGRSGQRFLVEVVAGNGEERRAVRAAGQDIYAITAPLAVEAVERLLSGRFTGTGALTAAQAFDARSVLDALPLTIGHGA
jgi:short subunit dehydrogenase-like uncharacterized protein